MKFGLWTIIHALFQLLIFPPLRSIALRWMGASVGKETVIHSIRFFNLDRTGFRGLRIGDRCFIGDECLFDLAEAVILEDDVTVAERVTLLTHMNVGYADHPLRTYFPPRAARVIIRHGAFIGACATILSGVEIGTCSMVGAGALVRSDVPAFSVTGGVPARIRAGRRLGERAPA